MLLSPHFSLHEFTRSQTASRLGIKNEPSEQHIYNLKIWCAKIGEPVRSHYGKPVIISSGYRCDDLNRAIGGSTGSQHRRGQAVDFEVAGVSNLNVAKWIEKNLEFDQLILEFYNICDPHSGWVHCSALEEGGRRSVLTAYRKDRKTHYEKGLPL
jgi:hypothetical protein